MTASRMTLERLLRDRAWLVALARRVVVDPSEADDVVQDAALIAMSRPPRDPAAAKGWLARVVVRLGLNRRRAATRRRAHEEAAPSPRRPHDPARLVEEWDVRRRIVEAVLALDEPYRETLLLRYFEGLSRAETAKRLGVSEEAVKSRQRRAFAELRTRLAEEDDDRRALLLLAGPALEVGPAAGEVSGGTEIPSTTSLIPASVAGGALVMGTTSKVLIGCAVVLALLGGMWFVGADDGDTDGPAVAVTDSDDRERGKGRHSGAAPTAEDDGGSAADGSGESNAWDDLDRSRDVHGVVLDPTGHPVDGATVRAVSRPGRLWDLLSVELSRSVVDGPATTSDADGRFRLRLEPGEVVSLWTSAEGFAESRHESVGAGARVEIELHPAAVLGLRVRDVDGNPVSGATVEAFVRTPYRDRQEHAVGQDGTLALSQLPQGAELFLFVHAPGFGGPWRHGIESLTTQVVEVVLPAGRKVEGVVVDRRDGTVVEGAVIGHEWVQLDAVHSGADGRFEIVMAAEGGSLHVSHPNYSRVEVEPAESGELRIELEPGDAITARIVDDDGDPVAGAIAHAVASRRESGRQSVSMGTARSDEEGRVLIEGLSRDRGHALVVLADGFGRLSTGFQPREGGPGTQDLGELVLVPSRLLRGRVVGPDGTPLVGQVVRIQLPTHRAAGGYADELELVTDDLGRFAARGLGPGAHTVGVAHQELGLLRDVVEIDADADPDPVVLRYEPPEAKGRFQVRVVDQAGVPVKGLRVMLTTDGARQATGVTNDSGVVDADVGGEVTLVQLLGAEAAGFVRPDSVHPGAGTRATEVVLERGVPIDGTAVDSSGEPLAQVSVRARWTTPTGMRWAFAPHTSEDGRFRVIVPPGQAVDLDGTWTSRGGPPRPALVGWLRGVEGGGPERSLRLTEPPRTGSVTVRLLDPDGDPIVGERVMTLPPGARAYEMAETDGTGRARFEGLPRTVLHFLGHWVLSHDGSVGVAERYPAPRTVYAEPDGQEIVLQVPPPATIEGVFVDRDGTPLSGALVSALGGSGAANALTDGQGRFRLLIDAEQPGPYRLMVQWSPVKGERAQQCGSIGGIHAGDTGVRITRVVR